MLVSLLAFDGQGRPTTKEFNGEATTVAQQITDMTALLTDFTAASDLGWTGYNMLALQAAAQAVGGAYANKDEAARLILALSNGRQYNMRIPAPKKNAGTGVYEYITGGTVDITNAIITDLVANFEAAGAFQISPGVTVSSIVRGYLEK